MRIKILIIFLSLCVYIWGIFLSMFHDNGNTLVQKRRKKKLYIKKGWFFGVATSCLLHRWYYNRYILCLFRRMDEYRIYILILFLCCFLNLNIKNMCTCRHQLFKCNLFICLSRVIFFFGRIGWYQYHPIFFIRFIEIYCNFFLFGIYLCIVSLSLHNFYITHTLWLIYFNRHTIITKFTMQFWLIS